MADGLETLEAFDNFAPARNALRHISAKTAEWAGLPMPIDGERLVVEPSFPFADIFQSVQPEPEPDDDVTLRNRWWSKRLRRDVFLYEEGGKIKAATLPRNSRLTMELHTLGCSYAWGIEQESNAVRLLGTLLKHHQFKQYMLTGAFLESSPRSGLTYLFRRLRPTVAIDARSKDASERARVLAALCMHPIAYYADTWAGAMTPTDDVIAHLMMMRGDECMFWRRSTQHAADHPEACL